MESNKFLKKFRENKDKTQAEFAAILGMSRQTYNNLENGSREVTIPELARLATHFSIPITELLTPLLESTEDTMVNSQTFEKFKEVLLYIFEKAGARHNIGQTVIYKILYFLDFNFYELHTRPITEATYIKNKYGPTPKEFIKVVTDLINNNELIEIENKYFNKMQKKYLPLRPSNLENILTDEEYKHVNKTIETYSAYNASDISELSHQDPPWKLVEFGEEIPYELVFKRKK